MSQEPQGKTRKKRPAKTDPGVQAESGICSREDFLASLNEMAREVLLSRDFDSTLHTLAIHMARLINADDCCITRWDTERERAVPVATSKKPGAPDLPDQDSFADELAVTTGVLEAGQVLTVDGLLDLPDTNEEAVKQVPTRAMLGVPLIVGEHKLGAAVISFNAPRRFSPEEIERSEQAGAYVALALWNFQQSLEIQQRLRESNALAKIGRALSETERVGIGKVLQLIVDSAREIIPHAEESVIHLLDREEQALVPEAISGFSIGDKKK
ncbi:MAG: GAF domain-containing protein [Chloroflexota bacterium]